MNIQVPLYPVAMQRLYKKVLWAVLSLTCVVVIGTFGYKYLGGDKASWLDCVYMTFITVTTIGFGEVIDMTHMPEGRVFTMILGVSGLGSLWFLFSATTALLLENDLNVAWRRRRMEQHIKNLSGHYLICGFGRVGRNVALELEITDRPYVAIDENETALDQHKEQKKPDLLYVAGDASDDELLERANIKNAIGVFAVTGDDSRNLMITISAKHLNPNARVIARCHEVRNFDKLTRAGADTVISPDFTGGMRIASAMIRPHVVNFLDEMLREQHNLRVEEIPIPDGFRERALSDISLKRAADYILLAVRTGDDWEFNPKQDFTLKSGYALIAMASPSGRLELEKALAN